MRKLGSVESKIYTLQIIFVVLTQQCFWILISSLMLCWKLAKDTA